ncbi:MAG: hypothetical protein KAI66_23955, partial [Lentisphaeria bacterium]|nr:hypothetical protein [Lentisphaeria bacterium]
MLRDALLRPAGHVLMDPQSASIAAVQYAYDNAGRLQSVADGDNLFSYGYEAGSGQIGNVIMTENRAKSVYTANSLNQYTQRTVPGVAQVRGKANAAAVVSVTAPGELPARADRLGEYFHRGVALDNTTGVAEANLTVTAVLPGQGPNGEDIVSEQTRAARVEATPQLFTHDDDGNIVRYLSHDAASLATSATLEYT